MNDFPKIKFSKKTQFFTLVNESNPTNKDLHILAQVMPGHYGLISLSEGNRWNDPVEVKNWPTFTVAETKAIFENCEGFYWVATEFDVEDYI